MNEIKATDLTITSIDRFFYIESKNLPEDFFVPRQTESVILFMDGAIEFHFEDMNLVAKAGDLFLLPGSCPKMLPFMYLIFMFHLLKIF